MNHTKKLAHLTWMRHLSRGVMVFGFVMSAGGNILHAEKTAVDILIALAAPTILALAFELVSRIPIRKEAHWLGKGLRIIATGTISAIMALISYFHQRDAIFAETHDQLQAYLLPAAIDALMIVGSVSLIELGVQVRDLEAFIAAGGTVKKVKEETPVPSKKDREPTGRERIAATWYNSPNLTIRQIAELAGTSYNYAAGVVGELRKLAEPSTEPEPATV